jgi:hypothetical protein
MLRVKHLTVPVKGGCCFALSYPFYTEPNRAETSQLVLSWPVYAYDIVAGTVLESVSN